MRKFGTIHILSAAAVVLLIIKTLCGMLYLDHQEKYGNNHIMHNFSFEATNTFVRRLTDVKMNVIIYTPTKTI